MREMGYRVGRKHATILRTIAVLALFIVPIVALVAALLAFGVVGFGETMVYYTWGAATVSGGMTRR